MRKTTARLLCAVGVLVLMACGAYALTTGDSLISLAYLTNTFMPNATQQGEKAANDKLKQTYDEMKGTLDALQSEYLSGSDAQGGTYSQTLQAQAWRAGDVLHLSTGAGVLMLSGEANVTHNGAVVDVTTGAEVASGANLSANHRYLVAEDTQANVSILSGAAQLGVQGGYVLSAGAEKIAPFYDVASTDWFYGPVNYVYQNNLFSGMDDYHFGPNAAMNRAMLMTVLYRMAGAPEQELAAANVSFDDVPSTAWYASYVKWGAQQKITAGTSQTTFSPERQVTREQVVALLYSFAGNYLKLSVEERADLSGYQDLGQVSDWAKDAFSWAVAQGVVSSSSATQLTLAPQKNANRAEVATMLRSFAEKIL